MNKLSNIMLLSATVWSALISLVSAINGEFVITAISSVIFIIEIILIEMKKKRGMWL
jgi:hypothetical protein